MTARLALRHGQFPGRRRAPAGGAVTGAATARASGRAVGTASASASAATFGQTTVGSTTDTLALNFKRVSQFALTSAGSASKVSAYLDGLGSGTGSQVAKVIIYPGTTGSGNISGNWVGYSNEVTVTDGQTAGWVDFTFASPVALTVGSWWLMVHTGDATNTIRVWRDATVDLTGSLGDTYSNGAGNPGGNQTLSAGPCSIYATYMPEPSAVTGAVVSKASARATAAAVSSRAGAVVVRAASRAQGSTPGVVTGAVVSRASARVSATGSGGTTPAGDNVLSGTDNVLSGTNEVIP